MHNKEPIMLPLFEQKMHQKCISAQGCALYSTEGAYNTPSDHVAVIQWKLGRVTMGKSGK